MFKSESAAEKGHAPSPGSRGTLDGLRHEGRGRLRAPVGGAGRPARPGRGRDRGRRLRRDGRRDGRRRPDGDRAWAGTPSCSSTRPRRAAYSARTARARPRGRDHREAAGARASTRCRSAAGRRSPSPAPSGSGRTPRTPWATCRSPASSNPPTSSPRTASPSPRSSPATGRSPRTCSARTRPPREALLTDGRAPRPGEVFAQPDLAGTLSAVAEGGADAFYNGRIARSMARGRPGGRRLPGRGGPRRPRDAVGRAHLDRLQGRTGLRDTAARTGHRGP